MLGWELPPHNSGGLGVASYNLCKSLAKNNIDIEFILPYDAPHDIDFMKITPARPEGVASIELSGIAYDSYKYIKNDGSVEWLNIFDQQKLYELSVLKLIETRDFTILHAHDWLTFRAALRVKEARNVPIILHVHSVESDRSGSKHGNPLVHEIENIALNIADRVIAVSQHTKNKIMEDYGVPADKIEVIHNSINPYDYQTCSDQTSYLYLSKLKQNGYKIITSIGRLTIQKGLPNLLHVAKKVIDLNPKTILFIVGSGEQYRELVELSANLGIGENVLFADFQRGKNYRDAYSIGDIFVMPSVSEPFGLTPLEAIGYGSPVLISKQSGVGEILQNCLKVDFWDIDEMTNKLNAVLNYPVLHDELYNNSKKEFDNMSWDHAANKVNSIYTNHLTGRA